MKRFLAIGLALLILCSMLPIQALNAQDSTPKEEVVYVNLDADGSVKEINVVNIFDLAEAGTIVDYGDYTALRNMTGTDAIDYKNGTVTIKADAGKLYYEGKLQGTELPWNVTVRYFLDGEELTAEQVGGKNGHLKITIGISRNEKSKTNFFDAFALQVVLSLDTNKCKHIVAEDATIANVGASKQLTHTILPGTGATLEITADVKDFSMDGIAINAIPLNLNIEVDNGTLKDQFNGLVEAVDKLDGGVKALKDGVSELEDGIKTDLKEGTQALSDGAKELANGASELQKGGSTLQSGAAELQSGTAALHDGVQTLNDGIKQIQTALNTLNKESATLTNGSETFLDAMNQLERSLYGISLDGGDLGALTAASSQILAGITALADGAQTLQQSISFDGFKATMASYGLDVDFLQSSNSSAAAAIQSAMNENSALLKLMGSLADSLDQVITLLDANNAFIDATGSYLDGLGSGAVEIINGAQELQNSYAQFDLVIAQLANSMGPLAQGVDQLASAVNTLVFEYSKLNDGIGTYTAAVAEIASGYAEVVSGAAQLAANTGKVKEGAAALHTGTGDLLQGVSALYEGAGTLNRGAGALDSGVGELLKGITRIYEGADEMQSGISGMYSEGTGFDDLISDKLDEILTEITGSGHETESYVSGKNTRVDAVQFVIKTAGVEAPAEALTEQPEPVRLTFWQKLLKLFGFDFQ